MLEFSITLTTKVFVDTFIYFRILMRSIIVVVEVVVVDKISVECEKFCVTPSLSKSYGVHLEIMTTKWQTASLIENEDAERSETESFVKLSDHQSDEDLKETEITIIATNTKPENVSSVANDDKFIKQRDLQESIKYGLQMLEHAQLTQKTEKIIKYLSMLTQDNKFSVSNKNKREYGHKLMEYLECGKDESMIIQINKLYQYMTQYAKYKTIFSNR